MRGALLVVAVVVVGCGGASTPDASPDTSGAGASSAAPAPAKGRPAIATKLCKADDMRACEGLCGEGSILSCVRWAHMLRAGMTMIVERYPGSDVQVPAAPGIARRLYTKACADGYAHACNLAGEMFDAGEGGEPDVQRARELYERACLGGSAQGCYRHAASFDDPSADTQRRAILSRACELGERYACSAYYDLDDEIFARGGVRAPSLPRRSIPGLACPMGTSAFRVVERSDMWIAIDRPRVLCGRGSPDEPHGPLLEWGSLEDEAASNGVLHTRGIYRDGKENGYWEFFDTTGVSIESGTYRDGVKDGLWKERDGDVEHTVRYEMGNVVSGE